MRRLCALSGMVLLASVIPAAALSPPVPVPSEEAVTESFEAIPLGTVDTPLRSAGGIWRADGDAEISTRRAKTGGQALRVFGGEERSVVFSFDVPRGPSLLDFWVERWTRRAPFELRLEVRSGESWQGVWSDDGSTVRIGGYHAHVDVRVDHAFDALRFTCTAPGGGGVLIDDLTIAPQGPMRVIEVTAESPALPVLHGRAVNPVAAVRIRTEGNLDPISVTSVRWSANAHDLGGRFRTVTNGRGALPSTRLHEVVLFGTEQLHRPFGRRGEAVPATLEFSGGQLLERGDNVFWLALEPDSGYGLDGHVVAACEAVTFAQGAAGSSDATRVEPVAPATVRKARPGIAVRDGGDDDCEVYRIPGLAVTKAGTLLAVYDARWTGWADLPGDIDVGCSRSTDGGRTWEPMQIILDMGRDPAWQFDGAGDPAILVDKVTGTIWVAAVWSHGNRGWNGSGPGLSPEDTGQLLLVRSHDDGRTWSRPINITSAVKDPAWCFVLQSPGNGISMDDGTLVFPAQYQDGARLPYAALLWSKDHGKTWRMGTGALGDTTEARVVELRPGTLMLNMRDNRGRGGIGARAVFLTHDLGTSWEPHETSGHALPEPVCNAGLVRVRETANPAGPWLVFCNPAVASPPRRDMTLKLSTDGGLSWPASQHLLLDQGTSAGYPSVALIDAETLGVLYESSRAHLVFQRVPLADLLAP